MTGAVMFFTPEHSVNASPTFGLVRCPTVFLLLFQCGFLAKEINYWLSSYKRRLSVVPHSVCTSFLARIVICEWEHLQGRIAVFENFFHNLYEFLGEDDERIEIPGN